MVKIDNSSAVREQYNSFVNSISLQNIRLVECAVNSGIERPLPKKTSIGIKFSTSLNGIKNDSDSVSFDSNAEAEIVFRSRDSDHILGTIKVNFILSYESKIQVEEEIIELFVKRNVPINAWPYLREFIQSMIQRMGWSTFILPPLRPNASSKKSSPRRKLPDKDR
jgi:preprotein translocase subunit SecB